MCCDFRKFRFVRNSKEIFFGELFFIIWTKIYFCTNYFQFVVRYPDKNHARHDARTSCGSCVRTRMQQFRAHSSKGVRGISVRRICVAVRNHSYRHASWSNETHRKLRYIKFNNRWSRNLFSSIFTERNFGFHTENSWIYQSPTNLFYLFIRILLTSKNDQSFAKFDLSG